MPIETATTLRTLMSMEWLIGFPLPADSNANSPRPALKSLTEHTEQQYQKETADLRAKLAERDAALTSCIDALTRIRDCQERKRGMTVGDVRMHQVIGWAADAIDSLPSSAKADAEILAAAEDYVRDYDAGELADFNRLRQAIRSKQSAGDKP